MIARLFGMKRRRPKGYTAQQWAILKRMKKQQHRQKEKRQEKFGPKSGALSSALPRLDGSPPRPVNAEAAAGVSHRGSVRKRK